MNSSHANLRDRAIQMLWVGNAMVGAFFAMLGGFLSLEKLGYDLHLSLFGLPAGEVLLAVGVLLILCAAWRICQAELAAKPAPAITTSRSNS